jgi:hypothetical protein
MQAEELNLEGKTFISAKRASELTGYTRDYVGQLARGGKIEARRIDRVWFIERDSLLAHKVQADQYVPTPPPVSPVQTHNPNAIVSLDGREFISAKRASDLFGYNADYISQLARDGKIDSKQIGGRWYVDRVQIFDHKKKNDSLLASVQSQAVGYVPPKPHSIAANGVAMPDLMHYGADGREDLIPNPIGSIKTEQKYDSLEIADDIEDEEVLDLRGQKVVAVAPIAYVREGTSSRKNFPILRATAYGVGALTVTAALFVGVVYIPKQAIVASVSNGATLQRYMDLIPEGFLSTKLSYKTIDW